MDGVWKLHVETKNKRRNAHWKLECRCTWCINTCSADTAVPDMNVNAHIFKKYYNLWDHKYIHVIHIHYIYQLDDWFNLYLHVDAYHTYACVHIMTCVRALSVLRIVCISEDWRLCMCTQYLRRYHTWMYTRTKVWYMSRYCRCNM